VGGYIGSKAELIVTRFKKELAAGVYMSCYALDKIADVHRCYSRKVLKLHCPFALAKMDAKAPKVRNNRARRDGAKFHGITGEGYEVVQRELRALVASRGLGYLKVARMANIPAPLAQEWLVRERPLLGAPLLSLLSALRLELTLQAKPTGLTDSDSYVMPKG